MTYSPVYACLIASVYGLFGRGFDSANIHVQKETGLILWVKSAGAPQFRKGCAARSLLGLQAVRDAQSPGFARGPCHLGFIQRRSFTQSASVQHVMQERTSVQLHAPVN